MIYFAFFLRFKKVFNAANKVYCYNIVDALIILFPGMYLASAVLFGLTIIVYRVWTLRQATNRVHVE